MSPVEVARTVRLRLAAELADDRAALAILAQAIVSLIAPAPDARGEWMRSLALAFEVERYYTAVEALLARALRAIDGDAPASGAWHQELLRGASVGIDGGRPALLSRAAANDLRELLKFRHLARHGYEVEPELGRMVEHAERIGRAHADLEGSLAAFDAWLRS